MANGKESEQTDLVGSGSVRSKKPEPKYGDVSFIETVQQSLPKYQGLNPHAVKQRALQDNEFFETLSEEVFQYSLSQEEQKLREEDPEQFGRIKNNFRKNFRKRLTKSSYSGESEKETLIKRTASLEDDVEKVAVEDYKDIIKSNPDKYKKYGLVDGKNFVYDDQDDATFAQQIVENQELHSELVTDRYNEFQDELSKQHNTASLLTDASKKTQAWVTYKEFGSEGLTQYINLLQHNQSDEPITERYQQQEQAQQFFRQAKKRGKNPTELIQEFVVGDGVEGVDYADTINQSASKRGIPPKLLSSLIKNESNFDPNAVSSAGAVGVSQMMPTTAREYGLKVPDELYELDKKRINATGQERQQLKKELARKTKEVATPENDERFNPEKSINAASRYLAKATDKFGHGEQTIASYNAGIRAVEDSLKKGGKNWKRLLPDETQKYIRKVSGDFSDEESKPSLLFNPLTKNKELENDIPEDNNHFTVNFYQRKGKGYDSRDAYKVSEAFLKRFAPDNYKKFLDGGDLKKNGQFSEEYSKLTYNIFEQAVNKNGFTTEDLMNTVKANGTYDQEDDAGWAFTYDELPIQARLAVDALRHQSETKQMFEYLGDGKYKFRPKRRQQSLDKFEQIKNAVFATKEKLVKGEDGNYKVEEETDNSGLWGLWNTAATVGLGAADALFRYVYEPTIRVTNNIGEGLGMDVDASRAFESRLKDYTGVDLASGLTQEEDGMVPNAVGEVAPFVEYIGAMMAGGSGLMKLGAKAFSKVTQAKKLFDGIRYGKGMAGSDRLRAMALRLEDAVTKGQPWATTSMTGEGLKRIIKSPIAYTGGAAVEASQPNEVSFYRMLPKLGGLDPTNPITKFYEQSGPAMRTALDAGGSFVVDSFFDTALAGSKFLTAKAGQRWFDRTEFKSMEYVGKSADGQTMGGYKVVDEPQFRQDLREFWFNMTKDLDEIPIGNVGDSMAKNFNVGEGYETLHDFTRKFLDDAGVVTKGIKSDIRDNIVHLNKRLGDTELDEKQIEQITEEQYGNFIDNVGRQVMGTMKTVNDELPLKFAQTLDEQVPIMKEFKPEGSRIDPSEMGAWRDKGYNLVSKEGKVYEVDPQFWTIDLADNIRQRSLRGTQDEVLQRKIDELPDNAKGETVEQVQQEVNDIVGTPVEVEGRTGYIVDYDDAGYIVRTADEDVRVQRMTNLDEGYLRERRIEQGLEELQQKQTTFRQTQQGMKQLSEAEQQARTGRKVQSTAKSGKILFKRASTPFQSETSRGLSQMRRRAAATSAAAQPQTLDDLMGRNVQFGEYEGVLRRDTENNIVVESGDRMVEVPVQKRGSVSPDEAGIAPKIQYDPESGSAIVDDNIYRYKRGMNSFEFENGEPVRANLRTTQGTERTFTNKQIVDELYDQRVLNQGIDNPIQSKVLSGRDNMLSQKYIRDYENRVRQVARELEEVNNFSAKLPFC